MTVTEVADYLRTTTTTIYRWLKEGKLTASKIGKEWRIDETTLNALLNRSNAAAPSTEHIWHTFRNNEHIMLIANRNSDIADFEAVFFKRGLAEGARLMKGCWWQDEDEVLDRYTQLGLDAAHLIRDGILSLFNLSKLYKNEGIEGPVRVWRESIDNAVSRGASRLWASGSPNMNCCGSDPGHVVAFEARLNDTIKHLPVIGVCPYSLEDEINREHFGKIVALTSHHSGVALYSNGQFSLMRSQ